MITPAFNLTATERVLPKLALDFTTAELDPRITFARSANTATVTDQSGAIVLLNADTPRFDYANGVCKGLLIEEARTNLLLNSIWDGAVAGTPGTAPTNWNIAFGTGETVLVSSGIYAAGNAVRLAATAGRQFFTQSFTASANTTYSVSVRCTLHSGTIPLIDVLDAASVPAGGTKSWTINGVSVASSTNVPIGDSVLNLFIVISSTAGTPNIRIGIGCGANRTADATFDTPQLEAGAFATSYIPTEATAVTRNADVATMTGTNFSDWYNQPEGTFFVSAIVPFDTSATYLNAGSGANGTVERNEVRINAGSIGYIVSNGGVPSVNIANGTHSASGDRVVATYKSTGAAISNLGVAPTTTGAMTPPIPNYLQIGARSATSGFANGVIQKINYWPQRLTNNEVRAFSK